MEEVDVLAPPDFRKSGKVKTIKQANIDGDWVGTFNLWIIKTLPTPSVLYQIRSPQSIWVPLTLDVTAGGHYKASEEIKDGLREVKEELGKEYTFESLKYVGRKLYIGQDTRGIKKHNVVDIFFVKDESHLDAYTLEKNEVYALCLCPIDELIKVHTIEEYSFKINALTNSREEIKIKVTKDSFPYNWDNYHFKIALLVKSFINEDKYLVY